MHQFPPFICLTLLILLTQSACSSLPEGEEGPRAEALTDKVLQATNTPQFINKTGAISFQIFSRSIFWDVRRGLVEVRFDDTIVQYHQKSWKNKVWENSVQVTDEKRKRDNFNKGYGYFVNDIYWFCPLLSLRAEGSKRYYIDEQRLRVTFPSGGVTPGDSYVFHLGEDYRPTSMDMWVKVIPIKGMKATFEDYKQLQSGTWIAMNHKMSVIHIEIENFQEIAAYPPTGGEDRFAALLAN